MPYQVNLTYFRESGKFYSEGSYESEKEQLYEIFDEVKDLSKRRTLPDLLEGHSEYYVLIDVPTHKHNHPHLIVVKRE